MIRMILGTQRGSGQSGGKSYALRLVLKLGLAVIRYRDRVRNLPRVVADFSMDLYSSLGSGMDRKTRNHGGQILRISF